MESLLRGRREGDGTTGFCTLVWAPRWYFLTELKPPGVGRQRAGGWCRQMG